MVSKFVNPALIQTLALIQTHCQKFRHSFFQNTNHTIAIWNNLPFPTVEAPGVDCFTLKMEYFITVHAYHDINILAFLFFYFIAQ